MLEKDVTHSWFFLSLVQRNDDEDERPISLEQQQQQQTTAANPWDFFSMGDGGFVAGDGGDEEKRVDEKKENTGERFTLKIAWSVRRWRSVNTKRGFLGAGGWSGEPSFLLQAEKTTRNDRKKRKESCV